MTRLIKSIPILTLAFLLAACGGQKGKFCLEGELKGVTEEIFLITSTDGGMDRVDTLQFDHEAFRFVCNLKDQATYRIVYPNMESIVVWGHSGDQITLKGDAQDLRNVRIEGNKENKLYTRFRLHINTLTQGDSIQEAAKDFIRDNAASPVAFEVYKQYCHNSTTSTKTTTDSLLMLMAEAQPDNMILGKYVKASKAQKQLEKGKTLPPFSLKDTKGNTHKSTDYKGRHLLLVVWAGWQSTNNNVFFNVRRLKDQGRLSNMDVLTISLDNDHNLLQAGMNTNDWPTIADLKGWHNPYIKKLGIRSVPYSILVDPQGKIVAASSNFSRDIQPELDRL